MRVRRLLRVLAITLLAGGAAVAATPAIKAPAPAKAVDMDRLYTGAWVEIARHPTKLTAGCVDGGISFERVDETRLRVRDFCHAAKPAGKLRSIGGPGIVQDPGFNARIHVSYQFLGIIPVARDLWVLDHADDYSWFIQADPSFENLWIFTRDARPDASLVKDLVVRAKSLGYDPAQLEVLGHP